MAAGLKNTKYIRHRIPALAIRAWIQRRLQGFVFTGRDLPAVIWRRKIFSSPCAFVKKWAMLERLCRWMALHPRRTLALAVMAALLPFLAKPFNLDDPLFIWAAHQIQAHPLDPYGFNVEWSWREFPMWKITENPPLACYYLALAALVAGWSEPALHAAFLLPALAVILGTFRLARHFCGSPMLAALVTLFTPVFLVSSTTVMCDVLMLAFWVWAVVFWIEGLEENRAHKLTAAGGLMALAVLTKYYGIYLVPLLAVYGCAVKRRPGQWAQFLLIPLATLWAYQYLMQKAYGTSPLAKAMNYSGFAQELYGFSQVSNGLSGLAFLGGCLAMILFLSPMLWNRRAVMIFSPFAIITAAVVFLDPSVLKKYGLIQSGGVHLAVEIQLAFWAVVGLSALALAAVDFATRRDAKSIVLGIWVVGTFLFATFLNWTVNARSLLPLAPALGILIARRWEQKNAVDLAGCRPGTALFMAIGAIFALYAAEADTLTASAVRENARAVYASYGRSGTLWFQGHWGFQFYMSRLGARPVDFESSRIKRGDIVAIPSNNTNFRPLAPGAADQLEIIYSPGACWLATVSQDLGASFYASALGPLPFAIGVVPPESVAVYRVAQ
jgi:4-amino-4-deoxy-L-arabinose transferase-like glycosyltransferase